MGRVNESWAKIKRFYWHTFGIPERIIDYMAVTDIIKKFLTGYSNMRIANTLKLSTKYVEDVLEEYIGFRGWKTDLDVNPLAIYNRCRGNYRCFVEDIRSVSSVISENFMIALYYLVKMYYQLVKEIEDNVK